MSAVVIVIAIAVIFLVLAYMPNEPVITALLVALSVGAAAYSDEIASMIKKGMK